MDTTLSTIKKSSSVKEYSEYEERTQEIQRRMPPRGCYEPVRINHLLDPLKQIINHPDRENLIKEFFKER